MKTVKSTGENINHYTGVRLRVTGAGNLQIRALSLDNVELQQLIPIPMQATTNIQPTRLCNFNQQRASFEFKTTEIDEVFVITRIVVFIRPIATSYPG